ncbi:hypothetical protein NKR19_g9663 [Coniochaeta hoffmannii]|uniref:Uncharacterized protein n=1 Tax=Coniochaeta hoffmannii TaxID=91930 RepID=A0AA38RI07_9PEZI|nr:hypothetical protein NKR19_g9663 [Coniochaeta hoffmannii]
MYIPALPRPFPNSRTSTAAQVEHGLPNPVPATDPSLVRPLHDATRSITRLLTNNGAAPNRKRDLQSQNVTIGIVVGVLLGVFIIGTIYFCVRYHRTIRFADRKKRIHRRSGGGGSSRGSKSSTSSGSTAPAAPPPAPPAPPPAAAAG